MLLLLDDGGGVAPTAAMRMTTADSQRAVRLHRIAESKEMVANRSESFRQRMTELAASVPLSAGSQKLSQHHLGSFVACETVVNMEARYTPPRVFAAKSPVLTSELLHRRLVVRDTVLDNMIRVGVLRSGFCFDEITGKHPMLALCDARC